MRFVLSLLLAVAALVNARTLHHQLHSYSFKDYVTEFNKAYDADEYATRKAIFDSRLTAIKAHNADASQTFKKGVNQLTDMTEEEYSALRGYKPSYNYHSSPERAAKIKLHAHRHEHEHKKQLPLAVDWRAQNVVTPVKDQGQCGSCWTFGTAQTVESHYAIKYGKLPILSEQQISDCSPNPKHCGGTGGCNGGTAEIGYAGIIAAGGLSSEWTYPYTSYFGNNNACTFNATKTRAVAKLSDYVVLPPNQEGPILNTVATVGPIAISVDASAWSSYESGVFSGCPSNPANQTVDIDHSVVLVGYGTDDQLGDYWLVRNSWSPSWGEDGYIRIKRQDTQCYNDPTPADGTGCDGGPASVSVCGPCGLFYDTAYPLIA